MEKAYKTNGGFEFTIFWPENDNRHVHPMVLAKKLHEKPLGFTLDPVKGPDGTVGKAICIYKIGAIWHPEAVAEIQAEYDRRRAIEDERKANSVNVVLSTLAWGDRGVLEISIDRRKPLADHLVAARAALESGDDVDQRNQTDAELTERIQAALGKAEAREKAKAAPPAPTYRPGEVHGDRPDLLNQPCPKCGTFCYGDCSAN